MVVTPRIERPPTRGEMTLLARGLRTDTQVQDEIIGVIEYWLVPALARLRREVTGNIMQDIITGAITPPPLASDLKAAVKAKPIWDDEEFWEAVSGEWSDGFEGIPLEGAAIASSYQASRFYFYVDMNAVNGAVRAFTAETYIPDLIKLDGPESIVAATRTGVRDVLVRWMDGELGDRGLPDLTSTLEQWFSPARAKRIAVTEATTVYAMGSEEAWKASYKDPYQQQATGIRAERWNTCNDEIARKCPVCWPLHGRQVLLGRDFPVPRGKPAAHPSCRCWLTPIKDYNPRMAP